MHHEYTNYLVSQIDDWNGEDDYGKSFAQIDLDTIEWDSLMAPVGLTGTAQGYISQVLANHFRARHVIVTWDSYGVRTVHAMRSFEHATEVMAELTEDYNDWISA